MNHPLIFSGTQFKFRNQIPAPKDIKLQEILRYAADGYQRGYTWQEKYTPGGPYSGGSKRDELNRKAWMNGFQEGLEAQRKRMRELRIFE